MKEGEEEEEEEEERKRRGGGEEERNDNYIVENQTRSIQWQCDCQRAFAPLGQSSGVGGSKLMRVSVLKKKQNGNDSRMNPTRQNFNRSKFCPIERFPLALRVNSKYTFILLPPSKLPKKVHLSHSLSYWYR